MSETMMNEIAKKLICIRCPVGCDIDVVFDENNAPQVTGNTCALGKEYAVSELSDPRRIITTTVKVKGGMQSLVSVWTTAPVPKDRVIDVVNFLRNIQIDAPVKVHDVIVADILGLGVDIEASQSIEAL